MHIQYPDLADVPTQRPHILPNLLRRFVYGNEEPPLPLLHTLMEELARQCRLPAPGRARYDIRPSRDEPSLEHLIDSGDSGAYPVVSPRSHIPPPSLWCSSGLGVTSDRGFIGSAGDSGGSSGGGGGPGGSIALPAGCPLPSPSLIRLY